MNFSRYLPWLATGSEFLHKIHLEVLANALSPDHESKVRGSGDFYSLGKSMAIDRFKRHFFIRIFNGLDKAEWKLAYIVHKDRTSNDFSSRISL